MSVRWPRRGEDEGMGLPEVLVAMFVFALVSVGLLHTILSVMTTTRDARARQVALNLAAQAIDDARFRDDLFNLLDSTTVVDVAGEEYTVRVDTEWVSDPTVDLACGAGGGVLRYKRVNVEVTWNNMRPVTEPVRADTVINPDSRLNDPAKGTILVSVVRGDGSGSPGVTVSATPIGAGVAPPSVVTDAEGCAYMLQVTPGDYRIQISRAGYVDVDQRATASKDVTVVQGSAASATFQYDRSASFTARLATNSPNPPEISANMPVTFVSTYGRVPMTGSGPNRVHALHPFASGYTAYAGTCTAADPSTWEPRDDAGTTFVGVLPEPVGAAPGGSASLDVPMGLVQVTVTGATNSYLRFESSPVDDDRCPTKVVYDFGNATGTRTIALPYGEWRIFRGTNTNRTTPVTTGVVPLTLGTFDPITGILTLDPREVPEP